MDLTRRTLFAGGIASATLLAAPAVIGQARPRVVVIGGGPGGATCARYLARDSKGALDVTLVEPNATYTTCFFSNLYLGGFRDYESLRHGYAGVADAGASVIAEEAVAVDRGMQSVTLSGGKVLGYDRLVLAPGIDFVEGSVPGWQLADAEIMPHAWKAGPQTELLKRQVEAMPQGGVFAMIAPPNPYRCPPGPYERVSMLAYLLKHRNPTAKILIFDAKDHFSKQALFEEAWGKYYDGMITWLNPEFGGADVEVSPATMEVIVEGSPQKVDVCNVIPAQVAGRIAALAGVTDESGWAPVRPEDMTSGIDPLVTVLGDAALQGDMPKSAFAANSQAKVAAMAIRGALTGSKVFPARYTNTCWSLLSDGDAVKVGGSYAPAEGRITATHTFISDTEEPPELRHAAYEEALGWYAGITADIFG